MQEKDEINEEDRRREPQKALPDSWDVKEMTERYAPYLLKRSVA